MNQELAQIILSFFEAEDSLHSYLCGRINAKLPINCIDVYCSTCCLHSYGKPNEQHYLDPFITFPLWE